MMNVKEIGEVRKIPFIQEIEWSIPNFFTVAEYEKEVCLSSSTFRVAGVLWHMRLWPCHEQLFLACEGFRDKSYRDQWLSFYLESDAHPEHSVKYYFGLKKGDGTVVHLFNGIVKKNEARNTDKYNFIKKTQLLQRKSELMPGNGLTIVCTMKWVTKAFQSSTQPETELENAKILKLMRLDKLSEDFKEFFGDKKTCDLTLQVQDKEYKVHRSVLMARSNVFAANFKHDTLERQTGIITITDCDPDSFPEFLDYLYSGKLEELSFRSARSLYYTSNKYDVEELKVFCVECLMHSLTIENVCEIAAFAVQYDETQLFKVVQEFFNENSLQIFLTSDWDNLMKKDLRLATRLLKKMSRMKLKM